MPQPAPAPAPMPVDLLRYLARIGYDGPVAPTLEVLRALQAAHIAAIPFEALDVLTGKGVEVDAVSVDAKLIDQRRGGYCYEQNSLFLRVLHAIGFDAEARLARVRWMMDDDAPVTARSHMALRVMLNGRPWLADVGFGAAAPTAPLAIDDPDPQPTVHETYRIRQSHAEGSGEWLVEALLGDRWTAMYVFDDVPQQPVDVAVANWYTATHPSSHFRRQLIAARADDTARYVLRDNRLTVRFPDGRVEQRYLTADDIEAALRDIFLLPVRPHWRPAIARAAVMEIAA